MAKLVSLDAVCEASRCLSATADVYTKLDMALKLAQEHPDAVFSLVMRSGPTSLAEIGGLNLKMLMRFMMGIYNEVKFVRAESESVLRDAGTELAPPKRGRECSTKAKKSTS